MAHAFTKIMTQNQTENVETNQDNGNLNDNLNQLEQNCSNNTVSKQWIDSQGQVLKSFIAYTNLSKREIEIYQDKPQEPLLIKAFLDEQYSPQQMVLNFARQCSDLNWHKNIDKQFIVYQKYVITEFPTYCCETHECVANCEIECQSCQKTYSCIKCVTCNCFKLSNNIKCKQCNTVQDINNKTCTKCNLILYERLCEVCGPQFVMNGEPIIHCSKCNRCHNIAHQYCKICGKCSEKETFIETHRHNPRSVVCCICNEIRHIEAMKYKILKKCECACCFTCMTLCDQVCKHGNHFGWLAEGLTWGGL